MEPVIDTIAAVATAPGQAGIAVVRISGPASLAIADKTLRTKGISPSKSESPALLHGLFCWNDEVIDDVLMLIMRAPRSYTREDVVEIQCHGGSVVSRRILRSVLDAGARLAGPGEFTMRAFMNGRLDLLQAEAVADIINAQSNRAASAAIEQLKGGLSDKIESIYAQVMELAATMEAGLDFPDDELPPVSREVTADGIDKAANELERLIDTHEEGRLLRQGARVVISGKPNVGKSTLLNRLLAAERAIVSHLPGTTRDTIEEHIIIDGFPVIITDTAGLRSTECEIEEEGIRRTKAMIDNADLHIYLTDSRFQLDNEDREYLGSHNSCKTILVRNKTDLGPCQADDFPGIANIDASLISGHGLEDIRKKIAEIIEADISLSSDPHSTISERHFKVLNSAYENLATAKNLVTDGESGYEILSASNLRDAAEAIGEVLGKNYHQELLDNIFGNFCIGK